MSDQTALWDRLGKTDPSHTKKFKRAGGFEGTAIKPIWSYRRMTEEFGPCGVGWGINEPSFQVVNGHNSEVLVYCTVSVWYHDAEAKSETVYGVGGDKVVTYIKANEKYQRPERWENDDEAFKKAYTDAVTNALKMIGVGADVHMGLYDDSKYVNSMRDEFSGKKADNVVPLAPPAEADGFPGDAPNPAKSSAQLKRDGAWQSVEADFWSDMNDVQSLHDLDKLRGQYRDRARKERWTRAWGEALGNLFDTEEERLKAGDPSELLRAG